MALKFAANISFMFKECGDIPARYAAARKAGFSAVESAFPVGPTLTDVREAWSQSGVEQVLLNAHPGDPEDGAKGLAALPGMEDKFKTSLEISIQYCKALNCKRLHLMSGVVSRAEGADTFERNLRHAVARLAEEEMVGLIEPISPQAVPGYFLSDYQYALDVIRRIGSEHLRLELDLFHLQNICGNVTNNLKELLPYTGHVQLAQPPHRHEPGVPGELDWRYVLGQLEQLGYSGWIGCEYVPSTADSADSLAWVTDLGYSL